MGDILDNVRLKGAAFAIEHGFFEWAEQMLAELSARASAGSAAAALRQRILDIQTAFWQARCRLASIVIARFPNYLAGRLYADLCRSHNRKGVSRQETDLIGTPNLASQSLVFYSFPPLFQMSPRRSRRKRESH